MDPLLRGIVRGDLPFALLSRGEVDGVDSLLLVFFFIAGGADVVLFFFVGGEQGSTRPWGSALSVRAAVHGVPSSCPRA